jgi:hypothetical protein
MINTVMFQRQLPVGAKEHSTLGWWGMLMLIATEAALFAYLLFSYFYLVSQSKSFWIPAAASPSLHLALPNTIILLASSLVLWRGERAMRRGLLQQPLFAIGLTLAMGSVFTVIQLIEWHKKSFTGDAVVDMTSTDPAHPSPLREEISLASFWFGILGAPLAWTIQEIVSYIGTSTQCKADGSSTIPAHTDTVWQSLLAINLLAMLLALFATGVAVYNWQKVRHEMSGNAHDLLDEGEGRTRFLAMFGLLTSAGFVIGLVFMIFTLFLAPLCG